VKQTLLDSGLMRSHHWMILRETVVIM